MAYLRLGRTQIRTLLALATIVATYGSYLAHSYLAASATSRSKLGDIAVGWSASVFCEMPEPATALLADESTGQLYIGTAGNADLYVHDLHRQFTTPTAIATGLGELPRYGMAEVSALAMIDVDGDGERELLAETSQVFPRGNPALMAWKLRPTMRMLAMAKLSIQSSWSHGLVSVQAGHGAPPSLLSTHCGNGEVVEYRLDQLKTRDGRIVTALGWQKVAQLPASGESVKVHRIGRGRDELCIAVGFAVGKAQLRFYESTSLSRPKGTPSFKTMGRSWTQTGAIDEGNRFANVRFVLGNIDCEDCRDLIAFWTTDLNGGDCEIVRYHIDACGEFTRAVLCRGKTDDLWPLENQIALVDIGDLGRNEIWFASLAGALWRHSGEPNEPPALVLKSNAGLGPIAPLGKRTLMVAADRTIYRIESVAALPGE